MTLWVLCCKGKKYCRRLKFGIFLTETVSTQNFPRFCWSRFIYFNTLMGTSLSWSGMPQGDMDECNFLYLLVDPQNWLGKYCTNCVLHQTRAGKKRVGFFFFLNNKLYIITNKPPTSRFTFTSIDNSRQGFYQNTWYTTVENRLSCLQPKVHTGLWLILALITEDFRHWDSLKLIIASFRALNLQRIQPLEQWEQQDIAFTGNCSMHRGYRV